MKQLSKYVVTLMLFCCSAFFTNAQKQVQYNLARLLDKSGLIIDTSNHARKLGDNHYPNAISLQKIAWLKGVSFNQGTIDIDLRGKNIFLQSFLGIAFHASGSNHYEVIYFRPFNFQYPDTARRRWSLQYMQVPDYPWNKLRQQHPLVYENSITPPPKASKWLHARIVVGNDSVEVFVNHASTPSLQVKRLGIADTGMIGLWDDGLSGDFANLSITE